MINNQWSFVIFCGEERSSLPELLRGSEREIELYELPLMLQQWYQTDRHNEFSGLGSKLPPFLQKADNLRSTSCQFLALFSSHRRVRSASAIARSLKRRRSLKSGCAEQYVTVIRKRRYQRCDN